MRLSATPRTYELFYTYIEAQHTDLVAAVNALLRNNGVLTPDEVDALSTKYLGQDRSLPTAYGVCTSLTEWLGRISEDVEAGASGLIDYSQSLDQVTAHMEDAGGDVLVPLVQELAMATRAARERNAALEHRLVEAHSQIEGMRHTMETVRNEVITDQLTGLSNRRYFDHVMAETMHRSFEHGQDMALILGDVDHFKAFNDTWGHQTGDQVLKLVSNVIRRSIKGRDVGARYGGEEFAIILPQTRMLDGRKLADAIRNEVSAKKLIKKSTGATLGRVTMSFGVAGLCSGDTVEEMIERADKALYAAKRAGRNCVRIADQGIDAVQRAA